MSYSNKPMAQWNDADVKAWVGSLNAFNAKQKQLICNGVDSIGCDGDSLACAESADELKDALEIPIILARKLHRQVQVYLGNGNSNNNDKNKKSNNNNNNNNNNNSSSSRQAQQQSQPKQETEEDVLARLIARNLQAKKDQPSKNMNNGSNVFGGNFNKPQQQQQQPKAKQGGLFSWGNNNQNANDFKINIQGSNGKLISLNQKCNKHTKIRQVKQLLASQEGGDPAKMVMKYNGRTMDDNHNLGFYGIADSRNLITVTFKVVGGN